LKNGSTSNRSNKSKRATTICLVIWSRAMANAVSQSQPSWPGSHLAPLFVILTLSASRPPPTSCLSALLAGPIHIADATATQFRVFGMAAHIFAVMPAAGAFAVGGRHHLHLEPFHGTGLEPLRRFRQRLESGGGSDGDEAQLFAQLLQQCLQFRS